MYIVSDKKFVMLKPSEIKPSANQPRKSFDEYELIKLAESIQASGIIQPLSVRKTEFGYELIAGERRLRAAIMVGLRRVPCIIHKTDDETAALYSLIENIQRSNLSVFEECEGLDRLIREYKMSQSEVAARLGMAQSTLSNKLRLLKLGDEIKERIVSANLTERHARALLRVPEKDREAVLNFIIAEALTINQTEDYITEFLAPPEAREKISAEPIRKTAIGDPRLFSNSLNKLLDTLQHAGINAKSQKHETAKYIEYKVRIPKIKDEPESFQQLKIC